MVAGYDTFAPTAGPPAAAGLYTAPRGRDAAAAQAQMVLEAEDGVRTLAAVSFLLDMLARRKLICCVLVSAVCDLCAG